MSDLAKFYGIYRGLVTNVTDPEDLFRIRATVPQVLGTTLSLPWAWPCVPFGIQNSLPVVGDPVWIMFEDGDVNNPVWMGGWAPRTGSP